MEIETDETPQKNTPKLLWSSAKSNRKPILTPNNKGKKCLHPRTPNTNCFMTIAGGMNITPPAKRFQPVRNPFEAALTERLHLPIIASPSLFQVPATPQMSSTQFEWTIEEVSSLKPANVEPHETQFHDAPDPEYEARAQLAISSYFKEQQIVPSPLNCPLRNQRIKLSDYKTPIGKPGRRIRECSTQTELSLPSILPIELEEALKPYFQPQLAISEEYLIDNKTKNHNTNSNCSELDIKDVSLRRKLFDMQNIIVLDSEEQKTPMTPKIKVNEKHHSNSSPIYVTAFIGKLSDSLDKSSFGSLSPISVTDGMGISPHSPDAGSKRKTRIKNLIEELDDIENLSPIRPLVHTVNKRRNFIDGNYRSRNFSTTTVDDISLLHDEKVNKFSPDRSSSPLRSLSELSAESVNIQISKLAVNNSMCGNNEENNKSIMKLDDKDCHLHDDTEEMIDCDDDDDMQISQLSQQSSNSDTPRVRKRLANRKNLSQSFSLGDYEDDNIHIENDNVQEKFDIINLPELNIESTTSSIVKPVGKLVPGQTFYRTDSGFNEMTTSALSTLQNDENSREATTTTTSIKNETIMQDISMRVCCSTPSRCITDF